jgi:hypothetical protein
VKRLLIVMLALMSLAGVFSINPADAATIAPANGDNVLSEQERIALNAIPVNQVTAADLADLRPRDLPGLDRDLRTKIQTPVATESTATSATEGGCNPFPGHACQRHFDRRWEHKNFWGWTLRLYVLGATWTYNGNRIWDVSSSDWGNAHWGYIYCGSQGPYEEWRGTGHQAKDISGWGTFAAGPAPGCNYPSYRYGGKYTVNHWGRVTIRSSQGPTGSF